MTARPIARMLSVYALGGVLCATALAGHFRLWRADLGIPLEYTAQGDASFDSMAVKAVLERGWVHDNPALGAPGAMQLHDFPGRTTGSASSSPSTRSWPCCSRWRPCWSGCRAAGRAGGRGVSTALLVACGVVTQVPLTARQDHDALTAAFLHDRAFVRQIEAALPPGAMVFQLPYLAMPEPLEKPCRMEAYGHLRGYPHSRRLRRSFGAIHGREVARWQQRVASEPAEALVRTLTAAGFRGLYLDTLGHGDGAAGLGGRLRTILGPPQPRSGNRRFVFFLSRPDGAGPA